MSLSRMRSRHLRWRYIMFAALKMKPLWTIHEVRDLLVQRMWTRFRETEAFGPADQKRSNANADLCLKIWHTPKMIIFAGKLRINQRILWGFPLTLQTNSFVKEVVLLFPRSRRANVFRSRTRQGIMAIVYPVLERWSPVHFHRAIGIDILIMFGWTAINQYTVHIPCLAP